MQVMSDETDKAVILAAGRGSRMQSDARCVGELSSEAGKLAGKGLKGLIPVAGRPFMDYNIQRLVDVGIEHICFVVSPEAAEFIEYGERVSSKFGIRVDYARQDSPRGTADAVLAGERAVGEDNFLLCNCDNLYPYSALEKLAGLPAGVSGVAGFERNELLRRSNIESERISSLAVLNMDREGNLEGIVEKPECPEAYKYRGSLWINMNLYRFTPAIFRFCRMIEPHPERGELELTEAVSCMLQTSEHPFRIIFASEAVLDMTERGDIRAVRRALEESGEI